MGTAAILDIDGTLVDTNYHHAITWSRAFRARNVKLPIWRIHRHIGMGGDQLVAALAVEVTRSRPPRPYSGNFERPRRPSAALLGLPGCSPANGASKVVARFLRGQYCTGSKGSAKWIL